MNAGLPGRRCFNRAAHVQVARELALDRTWRTTLRRTLRQLRQSPLGRQDWFVRNFQAAAVRAIERVTGG